MKELYYIKARVLVPREAWYSVLANDEQTARAYFDSLEFSNPQVIVDITRDKPESFWDNVETLGEAPNVSN